jgi:hypothetical protein
MLFLQLSGVNSLRDISNGLRSAEGDLNHLGISRSPAKSTLSSQNKVRDAKVFEEIYFMLLNRLEPSLQHRRAYARRIRRKVKILDSSIIPLCLELFEWAKFRTKKGAIKLHAVLDYDNCLPSYANITDGKTSDIKVARSILFPPGSIAVMDRAYVDFKWLNELDSKGVFFVTRIKENTSFEIVEDRRTKGRDDSIQADWNVRLTGATAGSNYPGLLRIVTVHDERKGQDIQLLTNHLNWTAENVGELYRSRWAIESFFKQVKQLFRVKTFVGTTANAVRIQLWTALIAILLLEYLQNKAKYAWSKSNLISFLRLNLYNKIEMWQWLHKPFLDRQTVNAQLNLFGVPPG